MDVGWVMVVEWDCMVEGLRCKRQFNGLLCVALHIHETTRLALMTAGVE